MKGVLLFVTCCLLVTLVRAIPPSSESFVLTGVVRDFWPCDGNGSPVSGCGTQASPQISCSGCHIDFEGAVTGDDRGVISNDLPSSLIPQLRQGAAPRTIQNFNNWYARGDPSYNHNITLMNRNPLCNTKDGDGVWDPCSPNVFSYIDGQFYPIDNRGFGNFQTTNHNLHFTYVIHGRLIYSGPSDKIGVNSEDDFWLYVNNKLAIDLGGVHDKESRKVNLGLDSLGLQRHQSYPFSIYFASRHTPASQFRLSTNVQLSCPYVDHCGVCRGDGQSCCKGCDDSNPCTTDSCDVLTGACVHKEKDCPSSNLCQVGRCNPSTGNCVFDAKVCRDNDACTTNDICYPASGCSFPKRICDDNNVCTLDSCNPSTGNCVHTQINCDDNDPCTDDSCDQNSGCIHAPKKCDDGDSCTTDRCVNGQCTTTRICATCAETCTTSDPCKKAECVNNNCVITNRVCNDNNLCTNDTCVNGNCVFTPFVCPGGNACSPNICNPTSGKCSASPISCDDGNLCTTDTCSVSGQNPVCSNTPITCTGGDLCRTPICNPTSGCGFAPIKDCDDNDLCTTDTCDGATGECRHTPVEVPDDGNACVDTYCDPFLGITSRDVTCRPSECKCDPQEGCQCPNWFEKLGDTEKGLGATALALIVVGSAAGVVFLAVGGKKGYDVWKTGHDMTTNVANNPLYENNGLGGANPLYKSPDDV